MPDVKLEQLSPDQVNARWQAWIGRIYDETISLGWNRRMFRMMRDIVQANTRLQQTGGHVIDWIFGNYVVAAAMTFRREPDAATNDDAQGVSQSLHSNEFARIAPSGSQRVF